MCYSNGTFHLHTAAVPMFVRSEVLSKDAFVPTCVCRLRHFPFSDRQKAKTRAHTSQVEEEVVCFPSRLSAPVVVQTAAVYCLCPKERKRPAPSSHRNGHTEPKRPQ